MGLSLRAHFTWSLLREGCPPPTSTDHHTAHRAESTASIPSSFQTIPFSPPIQTKANKTPGLGIVLGTPQMFSQYLFFFLKKKPTLPLQRLVPSAISSVSPDVAVILGARVGDGECSTLAMQFGVLKLREINLWSSYPVTAVRAPPKARQTFPPPPLAELLWKLRTVCLPAKSLKSCRTLCDPMDCSPPGSSVRGDSPGKNTGMGCHFLLQRTVFLPLTSAPPIL